MEENQNNPENLATAPVLLDREQYNKLMELLAEYRTDIVTIVETFQAITALFSGKTNALSMLPTIMKMISDPKMLDQFKDVLPIIEKYLPQPDPENGENN